MADIKLVQVWYRKAGRDLLDEFRGVEDVYVGDQGALKISQAEGRATVYAPGSWEKVNATSDMRESHLMREAPAAEEDGNGAG